ncbi:MAG TPA: NADH-quinone oxidoreductase subunit N [Candidatus Acidoferrales bacterium]|jgi:NADH-quinone oxidoreductase subunit N|nr:NADH-quinone oxidoreductase subunit N [Candidatus Acidoferrales bacterium]
MFPHTDDLLRALPELIWCGFGMLAMLLQPFVRSRHFFTALALVGAAGGTAAAFVAGATPGEGFYGLIQSDVFSFFFRLLVGLVAVLVVLAANSYLQRENLPFAEFYALLLFATAGMGVLASARELLTAFIGLELSSISSYILAGFRRDSTKSSEASLKYFLLGSFATAFFLYGIALVYGATGTTNLGRMDDADPNSNLLKLGLSLILIGIGFKVAAAPFQIWTPDVYEGAPTPVTALFSAGPKAAAFALLLRIFASVPAATHFWFWAFWVLAALTMFAGNLGALLQTNVKRLLAYSSIAHAGYILVAFAAVTFMANDLNGGATPAYAAVLFYLLSYALVKIGAFTIVSEIGGWGEKNLTLDDYAGLAQRQPVAAAALSLYLLSLLGLPVTAGFFGKFYIFKAAVNSHLIWLAVLMAINSIIGAYYYLRVIVVMYMREGSAEALAAAPVRFPVAVNVVLAVTAIGTVYFGLFPNQVLNFILQPNLIAR